MTAPCPLCRALVGVCVARPLVLAPHYPRSRP